SVVAGDPDPRQGSLRRMFVPISSQAWLSGTSGAFPGQGGHVQPDVRLPSALPCLPYGVVCRNSPGCRVGVRAVGNGPVLVGRRVVRDTGAPARDRDHEGVSG